MPSAERVARIETLFNHVERDTQLPDHFRKNAAALRAQLHHDPEGVLRRLQLAAAEIVSMLPGQHIQHDLGKCVGLESFFTWYIEDDAKAYAPTYNQYRLLTQTAADPNQKLHADLRQSDDLIAASRSWLVELRRLVGMTAQELIHALAIDYDPALVKLAMTVQSMHVHGVEVRRPTAADAVRNDYYRWDPDGLPYGWPEYIDNDIPTDAISFTEFTQ